MDISAKVIATDDALNTVQREINKIDRFRDWTLNKDYAAKIQIPNYPHFIRQYFRKLLDDDPEQLCKKAKIPKAFGFYNFGLNVSFTHPTELLLHDEVLHLMEPVKRLIELYGVVTFVNTYLHEAIRDKNHFNNFAHLNFHRDRHDVHENRFSLYSRNPFVEAQSGPRTASTIFIDNAVAYLQGLHEGIIDKGETGRRGKYEIFRTQNIKDLMGSVFLEQRWDAPVGCGEICMIDNRTVLHSSFKRSTDHGYRIGARYLF